jgi:glycosyltransferase involved in cell wall biosynthesis
MRSTVIDRYKYVIITPVYNEGENIRQTIESILKQSKLPEKWIIVDDGSTDNTKTIIAKYLKENAFITLIDNVHGKWPFGTHAVKNFYLGYSLLSDVEFDFVVKLDGDLYIDRADFFEQQVIRMHEDPKLGICSGITYSTHTGEKVITKDRPYWHTGGAMKFYRKKCFDDFNGLDPIYGWDGIDEYKAMSRGWKTRTFFDLHVNHLGKTRALDREKKIWLSEMKGKSYYLRGYPFEFILLRYVNLTLIKGQKSLADSFLNGYLKAKRERSERVVSKAEKTFMRKFQYLRMIDSIIFWKKLL